MSMGPLEHEGPWTEADLLALGETSQRIELLDGSLWVSPAQNGPHQDISGRLLATLLPGGDEAGLRVRLDVNVRLKSARIMQPDLIISRGPRAVSVTDASDVLLVCEITSPSNAITDRAVKRHLYAEAGIAWYLLIEPELTNYESVTLSLLRLTEDGYITYATARGDETLSLDHPFPVKIEANRLLGHHR